MTLRLLHILAAICVISLPGPAFAQVTAPVSLTPDTEVTLRFAEGDGRLVSADRTPATWNAFEIALARHMVSGSNMDSGSSATLHQYDNMPPRPTIMPGVVRLRFFHIAGRQTALFIENGTGRALVYRAAMTVNGQRSPTDLCLVPANDRGNEHWPYPIERLDLSDFTLIEWQAGRTVPCA